MFLKRLEIAGFKSFARRTVLEFRPGITAIVGPNGSGKSNVAEALRWALGEQSSRLLRARRMEEVIFAGAQGRPPAEKAEVTVLLAGDDGALSIARRAHRSGESDYWLNGRRARLREVQEALLRLTGATLNGASYAFIGQGMVEGFLEMRPSERRQLVEEAADVARYKARIQEAQARLAAAAEARGRLEAVAQELAPRLQQLRRQARRAALHAQLSQELAQALEDYYAALWHTAQSALAAARSRRAQAQEEVEGLRRQAARWREELTALEDELQARRRAAQRATQEREEAVRRLHRLEREVALAQQRLSDIAERRRELEEEEAALARELASLRATVGQGRLSQVLEALETARSQEEAARARLAEVEARWREAESRRQGAVERARRLREAAAEARERAQRLRALRGRRWAAAQDRRRELVQEMARQVQALRSLRQEEARLRAALARVAADINATEAEVEEARLALQRLEAQAEALRARLREAQDGSLPAAVPGLQGVLGQVLRVPQGLERAIAAALGEAVRALLVAGDEEALRGAMALCQDGAPRAILVPLEGVRTPPPPPQATGEGVLGVASRLVECDERFRAVVEALLGSVLVVEDAETARALCRRDGLTVVTRDGLVFYPWGGIGAGGEQHRRVIALERTAQELREAEQQAEEARRRLHAAQESLARLRQQARKYEEEDRRLSQALAERARRLGQLRGELRAVMESLARLHQEDEAALAEAVRTEEKASALLVEAEEAEKQAVALAQAVQELAPARQRALAEAVEAASRLAALEQEQKALRREEEGLRQREERLSQALASRRRQLEALRAQEEALTASLDPQRRELEECRQALAALPAVGPLLAEVSELEARERELRASLMQTQERLVEAERALAQAEAEEARWHRELEAAAKRAEEDGAPLPPQRPAPPGGDPRHLEERVRALRERLHRLGQVDPGAIDELRVVEGRYETLRAQLADLQEAEAAVRRAQEELEGWVVRRFRETFAAVAREFSHFFQSFFPGGEARLSLTGGQEPGVEIMARPPGKKVKSLGQLSGGERALTALAFLFALLSVNPFPFCVLDEADAMLDEANVGRFAEGLRRLAPRTQFIVITHNRRTIECADAVYGISMGPDGVSRALSLSLAEVLRS